VGKLYNTMQKKVIEQTEEYYGKNGKNNLCNPKIQDNFNDNNCAYLLL